MARLFFAFHVDALWPDVLPVGRILQPSERHMTVVFIGDFDKETILSKSRSFPLPHYAFAPIGIFDAPLLLPSPRKPRVMAWHANLREDLAELQAYVGVLSDYLYGEKIIEKIEERPFLPHVTLAREPFKKEPWLKSFAPLPFTMSALCLYESVGGLSYSPIWRHSFKAPIEMIEHTADLAYRIRGNDLRDIWKHAIHVLYSECPELLNVAPIESQFSCCTIEAIILQLNQMISRGDAAFGIRLKAVSYHGELVLSSEGCLEWEMIIDV